MKRSLFALAISMLAATTAIAGDDEVVIQFLSSEIVGEGALTSVTFNTPAIENLFATHGVTEIKSICSGFAASKVVDGFTVVMPNLRHYHLVSLPEGNGAGFMTAMMSQPEVSSIRSNEIEFEALSCDNPNDPAMTGIAAPYQWYMHPEVDGQGGRLDINMGQAWEIACASSGLPVLVAVFDHQVDIIAQELPVQQYDETIAPGGHGTAVYSIINATSDNDDRMAGVARNAVGKSYPLAVFQGYDAFAEMILDAVDVWEADIISCSMALVDIRYDKDVHKLLQYVYNSGVTIVVAGGQGSTPESPPNNGLPYPARYDDEVIAVGATARYESGWSGWSHYADEIDLAAPGEFIVALNNGGGWMTYPGQLFGGTSAAQPLVAGTVSLMHNVAPGLQPEDYEGMLEGYAYDVEDTGFDQYTGWGLLDAGRSVANLVGQYGVEHGTITGGSTVTSDYSAKVVGVEGIHEHLLHYIREYKHTLTTSWETAYEDSVWCWGMGAGTNGARKPHIDGATRIFNSAKCYRETSDLYGAVFTTYGYEIYEDDAYTTLLGTVGEISSGAVTVRYGVVGKREANAEAKLENRSSETGLSYVGQPYTAVGFDYHNLASQPNDYADLFVSMSGAGAKLYLCQQLTHSGVPFFADQTNQAFGGPLDSGLRGAAYADYDNDGDLDLFVAGGAGNLARLYRNEGDGTFTNQSSLLGTISRDHVHAAAWSDYDGDGWVDLYLCRRNSPGGAPLADVLLRNNMLAGGQFIDATATAGMADGAANITNSIAAVWGDVNGDNRPDLFVAEHDDAGDPADPTVHARLFVADASKIGTFTEVAGSAFGTSLADMNSITSVDVADVDLDGDADLVVGFEGQVQGAVIYRNDGSGVFPQADAITLPSINGTSGVSFLDLELDGRPDLLVTSSDAATEPQYYRNVLDSGSETAFVNTSGQSLPSDIGCAASGIVALDWNRDGDPDVFLGRESAMNSHFYRTTKLDGTDAPDQTFISIRLSSPSHVNNAAGIGAKVHVSQLNEMLVQWVDGGSGRGGQDDIVLTFPVDPLPSSDVAITVTWPNGWSQVTSVPRHSAGDDPFVVVDETNPTVVERSVSAYSEYDPAQDTMTFVFSWETEFGCDPAKDKITFSNVPPLCNLSETEITSETPGAVHSITRLTTGNYRHELRWTGWSCVPDCTIPYTVTSGHHSGIVSTCAQRQLKFRFCPSAL